MLLVFSLPEGILIFFFFDQWLYVFAWYRFKLYLHKKDSEKSIGKDVIYSLGHPACIIHIDVLTISVTLADDADSIKRHRRTRAYIYIAVPSKQ